MKQIYAAQSVAEAGLLRTILQEHGIPAIVENLNAPIPPAAPPTISVDDADEAEAVRLIQEHLAHPA